MIILKQLKRWESLNTWKKKIQKSLKIDEISKFMNVL